MELRWKVERYLCKEGVSASAFGRRAMGDPRFVHDLRRGREPRTRTIRRIEAFMAQGR